MNHNNSQAILILYTFFLLVLRTVSRIDMRRNEATIEGFRQIKIKSLHFSIFAMCHTVFR